jgi:hypothetical protein
MIRIAYLPKIGANGLAIHIRYRGDNQTWYLSIWVARYMRKHGIKECWFQLFNDTEWEWTHGVVILENGKARITQFG